MAKTANVLLGLAAGTAIGVGLGILFAPDKGKNTREKIKDSVSDKAEKLNILKEFFISISRTP